MPPRVVNDDKVKTILLAFGEVWICVAPACAVVTPVEKLAGVDVHCDAAASK